MAAAANYTEISSLKSNISNPAGKQPASPSVASSPDTRLDSYKKKLSNNKIVAFIAVIAITVVGIGTFFDSTEKIYNGMNRVFGTQPKVENPIKRSIEDELNIPKTRPLLDLPAQIRESGNIGTLSMYWEVILSNDGEHDLSVLEYSVMETSDTEFSSYTGLDQGLYSLIDSELRPVSLPTVIAAGQSSAFILKIGIQINEEAFLMIKDRFDGNVPIDVIEIETFLRTEGIDVYGNQIKKNPAIRAYQWPSIDTLQEPIFRAVFKTTRGETANALVSSYQYGIFQLLERQRIQE